MILDAWLVWGRRFRLVSPDAVPDRPLGACAGGRIELVGELVVGRENADVTVGDEKVSRRHLAVRPHEDGVELEDLESTNGTFVDGARLSAVVVVSSSARVILGETEFESRSRSPSPRSTSAPRACANDPPARRTIVARAPVAPVAAGATREWRAGITFLVLTATAIALIVSLAAR